MTEIKPIAIHLPQFHPFPENDSWWGKGFTEWTNVSKAVPRFKGHYQPHLPSDLGFYDLRLEEARVAQAELARQYGIYGFCYYHYWFNGKRLLHRPLDDMLKTQTPDFPFMLCWANENWTRRWDGQDQHVLMHQEYSEQDDRDHMRFLCEHFFSDKRYIRVGGKPFFVIYKPLLNRSMAKTLDIWREVALKLGIGELHLGYMWYSTEPAELQQAGFNCAIDFQPDMGVLPDRIGNDAFSRLLHRFNIHSSPHVLNQIYSYAAYVDKMIHERDYTHEKIYPGITPMWDNAARREKYATILTGSTPELYERWLSHIASEYSKVNIADKFLFINAWNEWAEGNHLEPCMKWGRSYLDKTLKALQRD